MKREAPTHTKMKRLCRALHVDLYQAVGILELIWHKTARERPRGDIGNGITNEDIALGIEYPHDEDELIAKLVRCGWLDEDPEYRLIVHDWHIHADEAVKKRLARSGETFIVSRRVETQPQNVATNGDLSSTRVRARPEPEPEPEPEPAPEPEPEREPSTHTPAPSPTPSSSTHVNGSVCVCSDSPEREKQKQQRDSPEDAYVAYWNRHCAPLGPVVDFTPDLRQQLRARIRAGLTPQKFAKVLRKTLATSMLMGKMQSGWIVDFAYVIADDDHISKILNGGFGKEDRSITPRESVEEEVIKGLPYRKRVMVSRRDDYPQKIAEERDEAMKLTEPERSKALAAVDAEEAEAQRVHAFIDSLKRERVEEVRADAAFLGQSEVRHANA